MFLKSLRFELVKHAETMYGVHCTLVEVQNKLYEFLLHYL